jgi:hypothetical protein
MLNCLLRNATRERGLDSLAQDKDR